MAAPDRRGSIAPVLECVVSQRYDIRSERLKALTAFGRLWSHSVTILGASLLANPRRTNRSADRA
jgi:hypothetical protein